MAVLFALTLQYSSHCVRNESTFVLSPVKIVGAFPKNFSVGGGVRVRVEGMLLHRPPRLHLRLPRLRLLRPLLQGVVSGRVAGVSLPFFRGVVLRGSCLKR